MVAVLLVHYAGLASSPPGWYVDEASVGYNAYTIGVDGHDEHGVAWPVFFEAFGEFKNPVAIYAAVLPVKLLGLTPSVVRGVSSTFALLAAAFLALVVTRLFRNRWLGLATFATAGFLPWFLIIGRIGFEVTAITTCLALFLLLWHRADQGGGWVPAVWSGVVLSVTIYSYSTARLYVALLTTAAVAVWLPGWRARWRQIIALVVPVVAGYVLLLRWMAANPGALTARWNEVSIFFDHPSGAEAVNRFWRGFTSEFSPAFWFYSGDPYPRLNTGRGGVFYAILAPIFALGLVGLWQRRTERFWVLVAAGTILAAVPAGLTTGFHHSIRDMAALPFLVLILALGAWVGHQALPRPQARRVALGLALLVGFEAAGFTFDYFTAYPARVIYWFDAGLVDAVHEAQAIHHSGPVVLSDRIDQASLMYGAITRENPATFRASHADGRVARVLPLDGSTPIPPGSVLVAKPDERPPGAQLWDVITLVHPDDYGHPRPTEVYRLWLVLSS